MISAFFNRIIRRVFANFWLKIGSLLLAIIIWTSVSNQGRTDKTFIGIPYELRNIPLNMEVTDRNIGIVQVAIRGPQNLISSLRAEDIIIPLELPNDVKQGEMHLKIHPSDVQTPYSNQLSILQVTPPDISIKLEKTMTAMRPIQPFIKGSPANGFELLDWLIEPPTVEIKGPYNSLTKLDKILTEPIDISGVNSTFKQRVRLESSSKFIHIVKPEHATISIRIKEKIIERTFPEFEITVLKPDPDPGITVYPNVITITIKGPLLGITSLQPKDIEVNVDCRNMTSGTHEIPLSIANQQAQLDSFNIDPPVVKVFVPTPNPELLSTPIEQSSSPK